MYQRLAAGEVDEADVVAGEDVERNLRIIKAYRMLRLPWELIDRETAKAASRVADAGDCEMAGPRTAIEQRL